MCGLRIEKNVVVNDIVAVREFLLKHLPADRGRRSVSHGI